MSNNLSLSQVSPSQSSKETTINDALGQLDAALTADLVLDASAGNVVVDATDLKRSVRLNITGNTVARTITFPASKKFFFLYNAGSYDASIIVGSTTLTLPTGARSIVYMDGTTNGIDMQVNVSGTFIPTGGATGQVLTKASGTDGDVIWHDGLVPGSGASGYVLTKNSGTSYDYDWAPATGGGGGGGGGGGTSGFGERGTFKPPTASWFNLAPGSFSIGDCTTTCTDDADRGMLIAATPTGGSAKFPMFMRDCTGWGSSWKVTARIVTAWLCAQFPGMGLWVIDNAGKSSGVIIEGTNSGYVNLQIPQHHSPPVTWQANPLNLTLNSAPTWFEVELISGTLHFRISVDGVHWTENTEALSSYVNGTLNWVGIGGDGTMSNVSGITVPWAGTVTYWSDPDHP